jgi:sugar-specific transcriptional regulator TrmB
MKDPKQILKNFSFNEKEIEIYMANLALGKANVARIAKKVGINRTAAYFHIKNLEKRGVLRPIKREGVVHYFAIPPEDLYENLNDWMNSLKGIMPFLDSLKKTEDEAPQISVVEAETGFMEIYENISNLPENSIFRIIEGSSGARSELQYVPEEKLDEFFKNIVKNNIKTRAIFSEGVLSQPKKSLDRNSMEIFRDRKWEISVLPEKSLPIKNVILIYQDKISFLLPSKTMVVTIKHKSITETFTEIFETLFVFGKKQDNPWE